jgi:hypothetical protein
MKINAFKSLNFNGIQLVKLRENEKQAYSIRVEYYGPPDLFYTDYIKHHKSVSINNASILEIVNSSLNAPNGDSQRIFNEKIISDVLEPLLKILKRDNLNLSIIGADSHEFLTPEEIFSKEEQKSLIKSIAGKISSMKLGEADPVFYTASSGNQNRVRFLNIKLDTQA